MKNPVILLILTFFLVLAGCDGSIPSADNSQHFDPIQAKKDYADISFSVADISEQSYKKGSAVAVSLTVPLDPADDFQSFFSITGKNNTVLPGAWVLSDNGLTVYFPDIEPSQT